MDENNANNAHKYRCTECPKSFKTARDLSTHVRRHDGDKPYNCSFCPKTFCTAYELDCHERSHTGDRPFKCAQCSASFATQAALANHKPRHLPDGEKGAFGCRHCPATFARAATRTAHERTHRGNCPYQCGVCGKKFPQKSNLTRHLKLHTAGKLLQCSVCTKSFGSAETLANHAKTCAELLQKCPQCGMAFTEKAGFEAHARSAHELESAESLSFDAPTLSSGEDTTDSDASGDEGVVGSKENQATGWAVALKPSRGKSCHSAVRSRADGDLRPEPRKADHVVPDQTDSSSDGDEDVAGEATAGAVAPVVTAAAKPTYKCTECEHWCSEWRALKEHAATEHRSDLAGYQFRCHLCHKTFTQNSNLKTHLKSHNRVAAFACDVCGRQFALKHHMQRHRARH